MCPGWDPDLNGRDIHVFFKMLSLCLCGLWSPPEHGPLLPGSKNICPVHPPGRSPWRVLAVRSGATPCRAAANSLLLWLSEMLSSHSFINPLSEELGRGPQCWLRGYLGSLILCISHTHDQSRHPDTIHASESLASSYTPSVPEFPFTLFSLWITESSSKWMRLLFCHPVAKAELGRQITKSPSLTLISSVYDLTVLSGNNETTGTTAS